jgi:hypothetical protein
LLPGFSARQDSTGGEHVAGGGVSGVAGFVAIVGDAAGGETMEVVELNLDPGFEERYIGELALL